MKYRNAADILPEELLSEVRKYAAGELLYVPREEARSEWGAASGARAFYAARNQEIRHKYHEGKRIGELADEYGLSTDTIRRILYK